MRLHLVEAVGLDMDGYLVLGVHLAACPFFGVRLELVIAYFRVTGNMEIVNLGHQSISSTSPTSETAGMWTRQVPLA